MDEILKSIPDLQSPQTPLLQIADLWNKDHILHADI